MSIKSKLGFTDGMLSPADIQSYIDELVVKVVARSNQDRDTAIANLRLEVHDLSNKIKGLSDKVGVLLPFAESKLKEEVASLNEQSISIKKESLYKKFFSGDNGFLYQLPDILCGIKEIEDGRVGLNEVGKFYAKNFYPVSNSIIVLESSLDNIAQSNEISKMSFDDLIQLREQFSKFIQESNVLEFPLFYTNLWNAIVEYLKPLCDPSFEERFEKEDCRSITEELYGLINSIKKRIADNGIEIIYYPDEESQSGFMPSNNNEIDFKPLIRREKDKYIYAYGLYKK